MENSLHVENNRKHCVLNLNRSSALLTAALRIRLAIFCIFVAVNESHETTKISIA